MACGGCCGWPCCGCEMVADGCAEAEGCCPPADAAPLEWAVVRLCEVASSRGTMSIRKSNMSDFARAEAMSER